jgi:hypothetical protein
VGGDESEESVSKDQLENRKKAMVTQNCFFSFSFYSVVVAIAFVALLYLTVL